MLRMCTSFVQSVQKRCHVRNSKLSYIQRMHEATSLSEMKGKTPQNVNKHRSVYCTAPVSWYWQCHVSMLCAPLSIRHIKSRREYKYYIDYTSIAILLFVLGASFIWNWMICLCEQKCVQHKHSNRQTHRGNSEAQRFTFCADKISENQTRQSAKSNVDIFLLHFFSCF